MILEAIAQHPGGPAPGVYNTIQQETTRTPVFKSWVDPARFPYGASVIIPSFHGKSAVVDVDTDFNFSHLPKYDHRDAYPAHYGHHDHCRDFGIGLMTMTGLLLWGIYEAPHAPSVHGLERESLRQLLRDLPNFQWSLRIAVFCSDTMSFKFSLICMQNELEVKGNVDVLISLFGEQAHRLKYRTLPYPALLLSNLDHAETTRESRTRGRGDAANSTRTTAK
ncbi:hypothetical protein B0H13DRAFT_1891824 [Mycena leptocephala]|nr:hypothetical protein B0H13DRAFT_1891824 [Mycena leptocephala]